MRMVRLLLPPLTFVTLSSAAPQRHRVSPLVTVLVTDEASGHPIPHPMVCIREFPQPLGAIGDSSGAAKFGGNLPAGTLHLRIKAPQHRDFDTTAMWPSNSEIRVKLKRLSSSASPQEC